MPTNKAQAYINTLEALLLDKEVIITVSTALHSVPIIIRRKVTKGKLDDVATKIANLPIHSVAVDREGNAIHFQSDHANITFIALDPITNWQDAPDGIITTIKATYAERAAAVVEELTSAFPVGEPLLINGRDAGKLQGLKLVERENANPDIVFTTDRQAFTYPMALLQYAYPGCLECNGETIQLSHTTPLVNWEAVDQAFDTLHY